jgi:ATP-dependent helicase/nuclease subunit B
VLMVGADAEHLPSRANETLFFANAVRRELGLATREMRQRQQLRDFAELLCANPEIVLSWQSCRNGEPNPASVWIERLQLALERRGSTGAAGAAGASGLRRHEARIKPARLVPAPPARPAPAAPHLLPARLSASGYNSFVACPYQFFATRMLGLSAMDELSELPQKNDYGDWLHRILAAYHEAIRDRPIRADAREALLREISERIFGNELDKNGAALAWYARWQKALPAYLAWANEREAAGWRFAFGEQYRETMLAWEGGQITLHGRIDRIDENGTGERAVLDYKTRNLKALRETLRDGEDHQLAFYGLLSDAPVSCAHYVALEPTAGKAGDAPAAAYAEWQQALRERIRAGLQAVSAGAPLPASGIEAVCRFCDVRGLCRKGTW